MRFVFVPAALAAAFFLCVPSAWAQRGPDGTPIDPCASREIAPGIPQLPNVPNLGFAAGHDRQAGSWRDGLARRQVTQTGCDTVAYGNPNSVQTQAFQTALGLEEFEPEVPMADVDAIGLNGTYWKAGGQDGQRIDGWYRHGSRIAEGSRTRFVIDLPVSVVRANAEGRGVFRLPVRTALLATLSAGVEFHATPDWTLTPRASYSIVVADKAFGGDRELVTASLSSLYRISNVGRGVVTVGNMVGYSTTTGDFLLDARDAGQTRNWMFRNGVAYQLPLQGRVFGRAGTLRGSYTYSILTKDVVPYDEVHQAAISLGVRGREGGQTSAFELLRIGLMYTHADHQFLPNAGFDAVTLTFGYRF